jgi:hypothetical protein
MDPDGPLRVRHRALPERKFALKVPASGSGNVLYESGLKFFEPGGIFMLSIQVLQGWPRAATAALALMSWYLVVPEDRSVIVPNGFAVATIFGTQGECEKAVGELRDQGYDLSATDSRYDPGDLAAAKRAWQEENARCVAEIDYSRFKGN